VPRALPRVCCNTAKVGDNEGRISGENGEQGSAKEMGENMAVGRVEVEVCGRGRGAGRRGGRARILLRRTVGRIRGMSTCTRLAMRVTTYPRSQSGLVYDLVVSAAQKLSQPITTPSVINNARSSLFWPLDCLESSTTIFRLLSF
jgi:hypothetical protein